MASGRRLGSAMLLTVALVMCFSAVSVSAISVMSVDLGLEWFKVGIVKPGVPMEIVLNFQSKRKTPAIVSVYNGERLVGDPARAVAVKQPKASFGYLQMLLGQKADSSIVELYRSWFPHYDIVAHESRGTVVFKTPDDNVYSVEELVAMLFDEARKQAEAYGGERIGGAVFTVPAFFGQAERRAVLDAAALAGITVLQLQNDNAAVALNYGVFRRAEFNATAQHILFYDMGAGSTTATLVAYYTGKVKEGKRTDTHPIAEILAVGYDRTLGGIQMEFRLRDHLADLFMKQKNVKNDVRKNSRAMIKLMKEAKRVKEVLSANTETIAQIESLADDIDFKAKVSRTEFEDMCADLFARAAAPVESALRATDIQLSSIQQVILFGGGPRIPKIQTILHQATARTELSKNINSDEAAALGAAFQAAGLSKAFKVKSFIVKDATLFPISVSFERAAQVEDDGTESPAKTVSRTLIQRNNPFPQKKVMTFSRQSGDFDITIEYGDLEFLPENQRALFGAKSIAKVQLSGLAEAIAKHDQDESKGVKVHFNLDANGILHVDSADAVYERPAAIVAAEEAEEAAKKSTLERLGDSISSFFGGTGTDGDVKAEGDEEPGSGEEESVAGEQASEGASKDETREEETREAPKEEAREESTEAPAGDESTPTDESAGEEKPEETKEEKTTADEKGEKEKEEKTEEAKKEDAQDAKKEEKKEEKKEPPKARVQKERLKLAESRLDLPSPSLDEIRAGRTRLEEINRKEDEKHEIERAKNELEAFSYTVRDKLTDAEFERVSTAAERESLLGMVDEATAWLYDAADATAADYRARHQKIRTPWDEIAHRHNELASRPRFLSDFKDMVNVTRTFLATARNISAEDRGQTDDDLEYIEKYLGDSEKWLSEKLEEQSKLEPHETPTLTTRDIGMRIKRIERELSSILRKPKPKPKPKAAPAKNTTTTTDGAKDEKAGADAKAEKDAESAEDAATRDETERDVPTGEGAEGGDAPADDDGADAGSADASEAKGESKQDEKKENEKKEETVDAPKKSKSERKPKSEGGKEGKRRPKRKTADTKGSDETLQLDGDKDEL